MRDDFGLALRMARRSPLFVAAAVLVLAFGAAITGAVVSAVAGWASFSRAVPNASRLIFIEPTDRGRPIAGGYLREAVFQRLFERRLQSLDVVFATIPEPAVLTSGELSEQVRLEAVSGKYFTALSVAPLFGRPLIDADQFSGGTVPIVLGELAWRRLFNANPQIIGRPVRLSGQPAEIVGVMPDAVRGFTMPTSTAVGVWAPLNAMRSVIAPARKKLSAQVFGRLAAGSSRADADAELRAIGTIDPASPGLGAAARPLDDGIAPRRTRMAFGTASLAVIALSLLVLLITCANLANLFLARATARMGEFAIRTALGASRWRLLRLQLTETLLISALGGGLGLWLVAWLVRAVGTFTLYASGPNVAVGTMVLNEWVLAYFFLIVCGSAAAIAAVPVWRTSRLSPASVLTASGARDLTGGRAGGRRQTALVAFQFAVSAVLLTIASLFLRSAIRAAHYDVAFDASRLGMASVDFSGTPLDDGRRPTLEAALLGAANGAPGVTKAALVSALPALGGGELVAIDAGTDAGPSSPCRLISATPGFESALDLPVRGRVFEARDAAGAPAVAIVNRSAGDALWRGADAVGRTVRVRRGPPIAVIGVAADADRTTRDAGDRCQIFLPMAQHRVNHAVVIGAGVTPDSLAALGSAVSAAALPAPVFDVQLASAWLRRSAGPLGAATTALALMAAVGLVISGVGLYGVTSYAVGLRAREFAIRQALGAPPRSIRTLVFAGAARMAATGAAAGLPLAAIASASLSHRLVGVSAFDPGTYAFVALILAAVVFGVVGPFAFRAPRRDAARSLRAL